ncbi:unnamed protein product [Boreogadus saida]
MEEKIIIAVSAMPVIFNTTLKSYKDRTVKAWLKVSEEVGLTEEECRRRWKVLRDTYLRVRRSQEAGKRSGSAAGPLKTWKTGLQSTQSRTTVQRQQQGQRVT